MSAKSLVLISQSSLLVIDSSFDRRAHMFGLRYFSNWYYVLLSIKPERKSVIGVILLVLD